jgi:hypothetical protein
MNTRGFRLLAATAAVFCVLGAGAIAARTALSGLEWPARLLQNPFRLVTRTGPSGAVVLQQVQKLQRLETCRYNGQVVVRGDTKGILPTWLAGDRILFIGQGEVVAGVDLAQLRPADVSVTGERLTLRLPRPEIFHSRLDNRRSEVYERQSGFFTGPDRSLEGKVRLEAEEQIRRAAVDSGVLATAGANAREALRGQLELLGFREVRFL